MQVPNGTGPDVQRSKRPLLPQCSDICIADINDFGKFAHSFGFYNIVVAFRGMHVSPAKHSYAWLPRKCDYRTDRRTDRRQTKWSLCAAMLRRRHKNASPYWELKGPYFVIISFPFSQHGERHEIQRGNHDPASHEDQTANLQIRSQHQEIPADPCLPKTGRGRRGRVLVSLTEVGLWEWPIRIGQGHFITITNDTFTPSIFVYDVHGTLHLCGHDARFLECFVLLNMYFYHTMLYW